MGQGLSSGEGKDAAVDYHPSSVGYSHSKKGNQSRRVKEDGVVPDQGTYKSSMVGPMRHRVKSKQPWAPPSTDLHSNQHTKYSQERLQSMDVNPVGHREKPVKRLFSSSQTSPSMPVNNNASVRGDYRISVLPAHPSIVEVPEPEALEIVQEASQQHASPAFVLPEQESYSLQSSDHGHTPTPIPSPLADALKFGLGSGFLSSSSSSEPPYSSSTHLKRSTQESNDAMLIAHWDSIDRENMRRTPRQPPSDISNRRIVSHSGVEVDSPTYSLAQSASSYRTVEESWTSHWEDRRGLGEDDTRFSSQIHFQWSSGEENSEVEESPPAINPALVSRVRRKPVPRDGEIAEQREVSVPPSSMEVGRQYILWPATMSDPVEVHSKRSSHLSRASATTDALLSHVEQIRSGPSYLIDRSASTLFKLNDSDEAITSTTASNSHADFLGSVANDFPRKRPRAQSLMAMIKGRVRKNSDATLTSSFNASPSKTGVASTSSAIALATAEPASSQLVVKANIDQEDSRSPHQKAFHFATVSSRGLYGLARRPSSKGLTAPIEEEEFHRDRAKVASRRPSSPRNVRWSRQSIRSVSSAKSIRSKRSSNASLRYSEQKRGKDKTSSVNILKQRSNSQPLPHQQQWWKSHLAWPRRGSMAAKQTRGISTGRQAEEGEDESAWMDEEGNTEDDRGIMAPVAQTIRVAGFGSSKGTAVERTKYDRRSRSIQGGFASPTGTDILLLETEQRALERSRAAQQTPPLAVIGKSDEAFRTYDHPHTYGPANPSSSTSTSTFSSLAPLPNPSPVPPQRPSRKTKRTDSSSNGGDTASQASPLPSPGSDGFGSRLGSRIAKTGRSSPVKSVGYLGIKGLVADHGASPTVASSSESFAASPVLKRGRASKSFSDSETKEVLLSEDSEPEMQDTKGTLGDEDDHKAIALQRHLDSVVPLVSKLNSPPLSPVKGSRESQEVRAPLSVEEGEGEEDDDDEEDSFTVTGEKYDSMPTMMTNARRAESLAPDDHRLVAIDDVVTPKRLLRAQTASAENQTNLRSVERSDSFGSSSYHPNSGLTSTRKKQIGERDHSIQQSLAISVPATKIINRSRRSYSVPSRPTSSATRTKIETAQATDTSRLHANTLNAARRASSQVRESWNSADGSWHADLVTLDAGSNSQLAALGTAKAKIRPKELLNRQKSSSSLSREAAFVERVDWTSGGSARGFEENMATEPVPYAETAVQASLAALAALERLDNGNDWQRRWARDKLLGSSTVPSTGSKLIAPAVHEQPSMSELSDYSFSRSRRRIAPYTRSKEDYSSSADDKTRKSARKKSHGSSRRKVPGSASQNGGNLTSDSDFAFHDHNYHQLRKLKGTLMTSETNMTDEKGQDRRPLSSTMEEMKKHSRPKIPSFAEMSGIPTRSEEDWDEKIVPALAKRLEVEAEQEAIMCDRSTASLSSSALAKRSQPSDGQRTVPTDRTAYAALRSSALETDGVRTTVASPHHLYKDKGKEIDSKTRTPSKTTRADDREEEKGDKRADHGSHSRSRRANPSTAENKRHGVFSSSTSVNKLPKVRKGYGCDDIKAWQASLHVAAPPATLVE
ncbi:hypothetical protein CBS101457_003620 [Exobasidium rhododendri]|nr:hypothetical protein CBS101457_003620 [Exobasidium rhododendri]